jgi:hypothetical protein
MKILDIKDIEDCFDGTFIKEVVFDTQIDETFVLKLKDFGDLRYFPQFAKPFFKMNVNGKYSFKGVIGNKSIRLILNRNKLEEALDEFLRLIETVNTMLDTQKG